MFVCILICRVQVKLEMGLRLQNLDMVDVLLLVFQGLLLNNVYFELYSVWPSANEHYMSCKLIAAIHFITNTLHLYLVIDTGFAVWENQRC